MGGERRAMITSATGAPKITSIGGRSDHRRARRDACTNEPASPRNASTRASHAAVKSRSRAGRGGRPPSSSRVSRSVSLATGSAATSASARAQACASTAAPAALRRAITASRDAGQRRATPRSGPRPARSRRAGAASRRATAASPAHRASLARRAPRRAPRHRRFNPPRRRASRTPRPACDTHRRADLRAQDHRASPRRRRRPRIGLLAQQPLVQRERARRIDELVLGRAAGRVERVGVGRRGFDCAHGRVERLPIVGRQIAGEVGVRDAGNQQQDD